MAAFAFDKTNTEMPQPKNVFLTFLDALAEAVMRQELRVIRRGKGTKTACADTDVREHSSTP